MNESLKGQEIFMSASEDSVKFKADTSKVFWYGKKKKIILYVKQIRVNNMRETFEF